MHMRWNLSSCLSEIRTTITACLLWWLWKMNIRRPPQLSPLRFVIITSNRKSRLSTSRSLNNSEGLFMFLKVRKSSSSTSVESLQSAVEDSVSQLEQQGLLSGEALGQIFTSVSDMLNAEAGQGQKDARTKVTECNRCWNCAEANTLLWYLWGSRLVLWSTQWRARRC